MKLTLQTSFFLLTIAFLSFCSCSSDQKAYVLKLNSERAETDLEFKDAEASILKENDRIDFKGLEYFDVNPKYKVNATYELISDGEIFEMKTSTDRLPVYKRYANLNFKLEGKDYRLTAYQNQKLIEEEEHKDHLFVPFTDLSNSVTSYGGGRYIDISKTDSNVIELDFNTCYNPYCAYNDKYSCPIPPIENHLDIEIPAGVKKFKEKH